MAKKLQENEGNYSYKDQNNLLDAKLAYALQQEYVRKSQAEESAGHRTQQRVYSNNLPIVYPGTNTYANSNQPYRPEEQKYNYGTGMNVNDPHPVLPGEKKKKKGFGSKIKSTIFF